MIGPAARGAFEQQAAKGPAAGETRALARRLRLGGADAIDLSASLAHAALAAPERTAAIYDEAAEGWFGAPVGAEPIHVAVEAPLAIPKAFWPAFWALVGGSAGRDSGDVTAATAALGGRLGETLTARQAAACLAWPGVRVAAGAGLPPRIRLEDLAGCPPASLGEAFHRLIVDNGFDLEVLDRDDLGLASLPPPLDYLNTRLLQTHDLWHIVAGYRTTKLHEAAISAFQLAQCGHGYSALFLALAVTSAAPARGPGFAMLLDTILSAWVHGRRTAPMLLIAWEEEWTDTTQAIRRRHGITPYRSPYPADVVEQAEAGI